MFFGCASSWAGSSISAGFFIGCSSKGGSANGVAHASAGYKLDGKQQAQNNGRREPAGKAILDNSPEQFRLVHRGVGCAPATSADCCSLLIARSIASIR